MPILRVGARCPDAPRPESIGKIMADAESSEFEESRRRRKKFADSKNIAQSSKFYGIISILAEESAKKRKPHTMPSVRIKDNESFEIAIRRFKRTVERTGVLSELRMRLAHEKPTTRRKRKFIAAVKRHKRNLRMQTLPRRLY